MSFLDDYPQLKIIQDIARRRKVAVYLVGGFLRDYLTALSHEGLDARNHLRRPACPAGRPACPCLAGRRAAGRFKDFDFAVEKDALRLARLFADKIKGAYVLLDEKRGCARVARKHKGQLATFDFADFRTRTFKGDLAHRDFTINTLSVDLSALNSSAGIPDVVIDFKHGLKDLKEKRIQQISPQAFQEDPLRMIRAFSLRAALGFTIEAGTLRQMKKDRHLIRGVAYERIRDELFKILQTDRAAENLKAMDKIGLLKNIIPQIGVMSYCRQGTYHHLNVWPHSLETVVQMEEIFRQIRSRRYAELHSIAQDLLEYLEENLGGDRKRSALMKLAALLHDIGKPETRKREGGRVTFHGHEHVGQNIVRHIAKMLKLSVQERHALEDMVLWHLRPGYLSNFQTPSERSIYRYFRNTQQEAASVLLLSLADQRSTRGPLTTPRDQKHHQDICLGLVKRYFEKKKEKPFVRLINGHDLIKKLKLEPGPAFARILAAVEESQVLGKITTKKEALLLAREIAKTPACRQAGAKFYAKKREIILK